MCIAESISRANRLQGMTVSESSYRTPVGVNRIWVYSKYRREGIATKLLDSVRYASNKNSMETNDCWLELKVWCHGFKPVEFCLK